LAAEDLHSWKTGIKENTLSVKEELDDGLEVTVVLFFISALPFVACKLP
jgi:hypothetical protein